MLSRPFSEPIGREFDCQGIYAILHEPSGRGYVGSSVSVRVRLTKHKSALQQSKHHSQYLQSCWSKYLGEGFVALLLEKVDRREDLAGREQVWIDKLDAYKTGFNARPKAENFFGMEWSEKQNEARRVSNRKTWSKPDLRQALSDRFSGQKRGTWTAESHLRATLALKERHQQNPEWRLRIKEVFSRPDIEDKRVDGVRRSLKDVNVREARVGQLKKASESPNRLQNLRSAYFLKYQRNSIGPSNNDELDALCKAMFDSNCSPPHSLQTTHTKR